MTTHSEDPVNPFEWNERNSTPGLTKREYFAALAINGRLSRDAHHDSKEIAEQAVEDADALIEELNK